MELWIPVTLAAAFAQTLRFMLQKVLAAGRLSAAGATFARFVWSMPLVWLLALAYARGTGAALPAIPAGFWPYAVAGGISQILATICVVALFKHRNFAVGITFKKTEVLLSVLAGIVILGEGISLASLAAILVGLVGVLLLSDPPGGGAGTWLRRIANPAAGLGLASGVFFGISGVSYRGASLSLESGDVLLRALVTLGCVTAFQTLALGGWLGWRQPGEVGRVFRNWRVSGLVGLTSMAGSIGWFTAYTLQSAGIVNAVGQVELIFSLLASWLFFRERITGRELAGIAVLVVSILALIATS
ncbi:membrane protein, putative [Oceanicola granulosus HTCC2516]|uniref:Membrane protein, putative n=1 Tax=Oceanicola granulosus (strain ATCC BAA-861 / DSM 15982 / KCTC 12143 / HTCC2516) TaxID=314256 RepID=Q2CFD9_OCEGH|nr:DMT family transporter [Oceanicola granulosus]EAR51356.1 membrane protein, putative [Oceanicola granulosus HTCC2516]